MNFEEQLTTIQTTMRGIVDAAKAANRDLTDAEMATLEAKSAEAGEIKGKLERSDESAALMARIGGMKDDRHATGTGEPILDGPDPWSKKATDALRGLTQTAPGGMKALTSGSVGVPAVLSSAVIDTHPRTVLDLIPTYNPTR